jgi:hypothetical protein
MSGSTGKKIKFLKVDDIKIPVGEKGGGSEKNLKNVKKKLLKCVYYGSGSMVGQRKLYKTIKSIKNPLLLEIVEKITEKDVKEFLSKQKIAQISQRPKKIKQFSKLIPIGKRYIIQLDLIGPIGDCKHVYALIVVDLFTRKGFGRPLQNKNAKNVGIAFVDILDEMDKQNKFPTNGKKVLISSDNGSEFTGLEFSENVDKWLEKKKKGTVKFKQSFGVPGVPQSQAYVERINQTVKGLFYKMMKAHNKPCFASFLDQAIDIYNNSIHSTIKMEPNKAETANEEDVKDRLYQSLKKMNQESYQEHQRRKLKKGDFVRLVSIKSEIGHKYLDNYREHVFVVSRVIMPKSSNGVMKYELEPNEKDNNNVRNLIQDKNDVKYKFKRNLLLKIPKKTDETPEDLVTFKEWCGMCDASCIDYNQFLKEAKKQRKEKENKKQDSDQEIENFESNVLASRNWTTLEIPEKIKLKIERQFENGVYRSRLILKEIEKTRDFNSYMKFAIEFCFEYICHDHGSKAIVNQFNKSAVKFKKEIEKLKLSYDKGNSKIKFLNQHGDISIGIKDRSNWLELLTTIMLPIRNVDKIRFIESTIKIIKYDASECFVSRKKTLKTSAIKTFSKPGKKNKEILGGTKGRTRQQSKQSNSRKQKESSRKQRESSRKETSLSKVKTSSRSTRQRPRKVLSSGLNDESTFQNKY